MLLEGNTIIVTEGNSGIGEAIVLAAASEGANIVIDYVTNKESTTSRIRMRRTASSRKSRPPVAVPSEWTRMSARSTTYAR